ncbi:glycoside hydrolase family 98 domain-containing protein [Paenibacillus sp. LHD-38]|uniref:glycoside hydrolase family 98 domain-containing protein n=1 Tax=Paenibacillus sp. LHD-38 TaxID=3072143 RepID=UPI00280C4B95|nr:glycosyl hydrolase family 98 C-terminal domain-containing protein [Paenibacillus sp. LHD-38]MDQ8734776.1 glycosyl hydrolase family 98 C-terminal domain-containing protein [Paenibacillus sp. LHD-38]
MRRRSLFNRFSCTLLAIFVVVCGSVSGIGTVGAESESRLIRFEAEESDNNAEIQMNRNASGGITLGNFDHVVGRYVDFNEIYVPAAGSYDLNIGYFAPSNTTFSLQVNGDAAAKSAKGKGNWDTPGTETYKVELNAGVNSIKFVSVAGTVMDVDYLEAVGAVDAPLQAGWIEVEDTSNLITYQGQWSTVNKSASRGGAAKQTTQVGASAAFTFTGTGIQWIGKKAPNFGSAKIYLDDQLVGIQNVSGTTKFQQDLYTLIGLPLGEHTVKIENAGGSGTSGNGIEVDSLAFTADTTPIEADSLVVTPGKSRVKIGETKQLSASAMSGSQHVYGGDVTYSSSDVRVASVGEHTGMITAVASGTAIITASYGSFTTTATVIVSEPLSGGKRMEVDNDHPLLIIPVYGKEYDPVESTFQWEDTLLGRWDSIPDDVKPYAVMEIHAGSIGMGNEAEMKAFYTQQMEIAEENNIPVLLLTMTAGNKPYYTGVSSLTPAWAQSMYDQYSSLVGLMSSENYWIYDDSLASLAADYIKVSADNGGYFVWSEQNQGNTIEKSISNAKFRKAMEDHGDSFIFTFKNTPQSGGTSAETISYMAGLWLTDHVAQWGGLIDTWTWWERKDWKLFEESRLPGLANGGEEDRSVATFPEALLSIQMMNIYLNGGNVYNFEHPAYTTGIEDKTTPAFDHAIIDFMRYAIEHPAPTKEEIQAKTKIVVHDNISNLGGNKFYSGLNVEDAETTTYSTGRYGIIPVVPALMSRASVTSAFPEAAILTRTSPEISSQQQKVNFFNSVYLANYTGTAFAQAIDDIWYLYNHLENKNVNQTAKFKLLEADTTVDALLEPHTYVILNDNKGSVNVKLNNYRVDKDNIWEGYTASTQRWNTDVNNLFQDWIKSEYMTNTRDNVMRTTTLTFDNLTAVPKIEALTGLAEQYEQPEVAFDQETGVATITISSNGYMSFNIVTESAEPGQTGKLSGVLQGGEEVQLGQDLTVVYGLQHVKDQISAKDVTFTYDASKLELVSYESIRPEFKIVDTIETPGKLRIIAVGLGSEHSITADGDVLQLQFKAKSATDEDGTKVQTIDGVAANGSGIETEVADAAMNIVIKVSNPGDVNGDGKISIGDLGLVAAAYGKTSSDPDWAKYAKFDIVKDGKIDILDLATVGSKIVAAP